MFRLISRVQIAYVGLFVIVCAGVFAYEGLYIWPMQQCESGGGWWSAKYRECATPMRVRRRNRPKSAHRSMVATRTSRRTALWKPLRISATIRSA